MAGGPISFFLPKPLVLVRLLWEQVTEAESKPSIWQEGNVLVHVTGKGSGEAQRRQEQQQKTEPTPLEPGTHHLKNHLSIHFSSLFDSAQLPAQTVSTGQLQNHILPRLATPAEGENLLPMSVYSPRVWILMGPA